MPGLFETFVAAAAVSIMAAIAAVSCAVALLAAAAAGRAARAGRPALFLPAWLVGAASISAARLAIGDLADGVALGSGELGVRGAGESVQDHAVTAVAVMAVGLALTWAIARFVPRRGLGGLSSRSALREDYAARVGSFGERLVAAELARLGWPALHSVVLVDWRGRTTEIDHLVRAPDGIVVLETKTLGGFVEGHEGQRWWLHRRSQGEPMRFLSPVVQNLGHIRAVERLVGGTGVSVRGLLVSAGRAQFAAPIAHLFVPVGGVRYALLDGRLGRFGRTGHLDQAWRRIEAAAAGSAGRRGAHVMAQRRRRLFERLDFGW